jgi:hypothetical protein
VTVDVPIEGKTKETWATSFFVQEDAPSWFIDKFMFPCLKIRNSFAAVRKEITNKFEEIQRIRAEENQLRNIKIDEILASFK